MLKRKKNARNKTRDGRCKTGWRGIESLDHVVREDFFDDVSFVEIPQTTENTSLLPFEIHLIYFLGRERRTFAVQKHRGQSNGESKNSNSAEAKEP